MQRNRICWHLLLLAAAGALAACGTAQPTLETSLGRVPAATAAAAWPTATGQVSPASLAAKASKTPVLGTPTSAEVMAIQQRLRDMNRDMLRIHQELPQLKRERQQQVGQLMADLMSETTQLVSMVEQAVNELPPDERPELADALARMQANVQKMRQTVPEATSGPGSMMGPWATSGLGPRPAGTAPATPAGVPTMGQMAQEMGQMREQMRAHMQQMSSQEMQAMVAAMADMADSMDELISQMGPAISRMRPEQRQALLEQVERMQAVMQRMMELVESAPTASPSAVGTPTAH